MKQKRFKDELRQSLILHSLIPAAAAIFGFMLCAYLGWRYSLAAATDDAVKSYAVYIDAVLEDYADFLARSWYFNPAKAGREPNYATEINRSLYRFLNTQKVRGIFYLADADCNITFSSERNGAGAAYSGGALPSARAAHIKMVCEHFLADKHSDGVLWYEKESGFPALYLCSRLHQGGYLCFVFPPESIFSAAANVPLLFAVTDRFGRIFGANAALFSGSFGKLNKNMLDRGSFLLYGGQNFYVRKIPLKYNQLELYTAKDVQDIFRMFAVLTAAVSAIFLLMIALIWISAHFIADKKTRLIDTIVRSFQKAAAGDLQERLDISGQEEFEIIGKSYNSMIESLQNLIKTNEEQMQQALTLNLKQMESQFNAHFLFNTLETVRFMSRLNPKAVETIVVCLSKLLRYSITASKETVTLAEDISNVKDYINILSYRFGERLRCDINLPPELLDYIVPKLIFQPIVENSIKYGLEESERIRIEITAESGEDELRIKIADDGPGIETETLRKLLDRIYENTAGPHIGLYNVHRRLFLMFGKPYGITIVSTKNKGTEVELHLPRIKRTA